MNTAPTQRLCLLLLPCTLCTLQIHCIHVHNRFVVNVAGFLCVCFAISRANWRYICVFGIIRGVVSAHAFARNLYNVQSGEQQQNSVSTRHDEHLSTRVGVSFYCFIQPRCALRRLADTPIMWHNAARNYVCIHYVYEIEECSMCVYVRHTESQHTDAGTEAHRYTRGLRAPFRYVLQHTPFTPFTSLTRACMQQHVHAMHMHCYSTCTRPSVCTCPPVCAMRIVTMQLIQMVMRAARVAKLRSTQLCCFMR